MKKQIYLIDLTHESKLGLGSDHMPLQLGLIGAYLVKEHGDKVEVTLFKFLKDFEEAVKREVPFAVGSSNYMWNIDLSYRAASLIKVKYPNVVTIFGGPNYPTVPDEQVEWLRRYPNIDFYIFRDGEIAFARLVGFLLENFDITAAKKAKLPSCHAFVDGQPYWGPLETRLMDLTVTPSPYLLGFMDSFFNYPLVPSMQTNRGCPFACTFCVEGEGYYNKVATIKFERKKSEVDYIVDHVKHTKTLRVVDSNFGMFKDDIEFCQYLSQVQGKTGFPDYVSCSAGKNQKERILKCNELLNGAMRVTASVQSLVPEVLQNIKRSNISLDTLMEMSDKVSDTDTHAYSEMILGLPGDSLAGEEQSMKGLVQAGISTITQHQLALLPGTEMALRSSREKFGLRSMFRPIQRCVGLYTFDDQTFPAIDVEEICVENNTMSYQDYLEARRLYLTVGLFYNDRIFGEINALLRLLQLSTWDWLKKIHNSVNVASESIRNLYDGFIRDTEAELWPTQEELVRDVSANINKFVDGDAGGNLIYKYRSLSIVTCFAELNAMAFRCLREYLVEKGLSCDDIVNDLERFSRHQKGDIFNLDFETKEQFDYDVIKLIRDPSLARDKKPLSDLLYPNQLHFSHTDQQKESIKDRLKFYGEGIAGLTMLLSRFPLKRFYRTVVQSPAVTNIQSPLVTN